MVIVINIIMLTKIYSWYTGTAIFMFGSLRLAIIVKFCILRNNLDSRCCKVRQDIETQRLKPYFALKRWKMSCSIT